MPRPVTGSGATQEMRAALVSGATDANLVRVQADACMFDRRRGKSPAAPELLVGVAGGGFSYRRLDGARRDRTCFRSCRGRPVDITSIRFDGHEGDVWTHQPPPRNGIEPPPIAATGMLVVLNRLVSPSHDERRPAGFSSTSLHLWDLSPPTATKSLPSPMHAYFRPVDAFPSIRPLLLSCTVVLFQPTLLCPTTATPAKRGHTPAEPDD